jgi:hypothetical protein
MAMLEIFDRHCAWANHLSLRTGPALAATWARRPP